MKNKIQNGQFTKELQENVGEGVNSAPKKIIEDEKLLMTLLFPKINKTKDTEGETEQARKARIIEEAKPVIELLTIVRNCDKEATAATFESLIRHSMRIDHMVSNNQGTRQQIQEAIKTIDKEQKLGEIDKEAQRKYQEIQEKEKTGGEQIKTPYMEYMKFIEAEKSLEAEIAPYLVNAELTILDKPEDNAKDKMQKRAEALLELKQLTSAEKREVRQIELKIDPLDKDKCSLLGRFLASKGNDYLMSNSYLLHEYNEIARNNLELKPFPMGEDQEASGKDRAE